MTEPNKLREEFMLWINEHYGHDGMSGTYDQDEAVADWWLSRLKQDRQRLVEIIKSRKIKDESMGVYTDFGRCDSFNNALDQVINLIEEE